MLRLTINKVFSHITSELILKLLLIILIFFTLSPILDLKSNEISFVETSTLISTSKSVTYEIRLVENITIVPENGEDLDIEVEFSQGDEIRIELSSSIEKPVGLTIYDPENIILMNDKASNSISYLLLEKNGTYRIHVSDFSGSGKIYLKILKLENKLTFYYTITTQIIETKYVSEQYTSLSEISLTTPTHETTPSSSQTPLSYPYLLFILLPIAIVVILLFKKHRQRAMTDSQ